MEELIVLIIIGIIFWKIRKVINKWNNGEMEYRERLKFLIEGRKYKENYNILRHKKLFTYSELILYNQLKKYLKGIEVNLLSKVRLADFIDIKSNNKSEWQTQFNKISRKHIDFIITDIKGNILLLIELDGDSHNNYQTRKNDEYKNKIFKNMELPLIRYYNNSYHNLTYIDKYINKETKSKINN